MPFDIEFNAVYELISEISQDPKLNNSFEIFRADDLLHQRNILKDIIESISNSDLIIAELTSLNPNVFYELGLSHGLRKDVILLTQDIEELPFDLKSYRIITYSTHFQKIKTFKNTLFSIFQGILNNSISFSSPVSDFLKKPLKTKEESSSDVKETDNGDKVYFEKGIIDFICDFQESSEFLTKLILKFNDKTIELSKQIKHNEGELIKANENPSQGTISYVRKIMHKTASILNEYTDFVSEHNKLYNDKWVSFENGIINWLNSPKLDVSSDNISELTNLFPVIKSLKDSMINAKSENDKMAKAVSSLKGFERKINRASMLLENEIIVFSSLIGKSISTLDKTNNLIQQIKSNVSN